MSDPGGSRRTTPLPRDWRWRRAHVLRRDGYRCQIVGPRCAGRAAEVDHVVPAHLGGTDDLTNLQAACGPCHASKTGAEARAVQGSRRRPEEPHPGRL